MSVVPATATRDALKRLHQELESESGEKPTLEDFYPVDVERLLKSLGWEVKVVAETQSIGVSPDYVSNVDAQLLPEEKVIYIKDGKSRGRRHFTLAHELGHILLGHVDCTNHPLQRTTRPTASRRIARPVQRPSHERDADLFAIELLLPPKAVKRKFVNRFARSQISRLDQQARDLATAAGFPSRANLTAKQLAEIMASNKDNGLPSLTDSFGVSRSAMAIRLLELELVI